jgi:hypothetical protein
MVETKKTRTVVYLMMRREIEKSRMLIKMLYSERP